MTSTIKNRIRDLLNADLLGKESDAMLAAGLGDILSVLLDTRNANTTVAATTVGAALVATAQADATTPANVGYTQADQTAIADLANALKVLVNDCVARINQLRVDVLALRSELAAINTAGTVGGATEAGITVTSNVATLAAQPSTLITVNAVAGTATGVKRLVRDVTRSPQTGEVLWDGGLRLTFAVADAVSSCDVIYAKADGSQKASCLEALAPQ
jgi:hypothetical protein